MKSSAKKNSITLDDVARMMQRGFETIDQTPSLPDANPRSTRPRSGGRESNFPAETGRAYWESKGMKRIFAGLLCIALPCLCGIARADITYTLTPFVGAHTTLTGSITVDHTGTLTSSDITGFSLTSSSNTNGSFFTISAPTAVVGGGSFVLMATSTSLSFDDVQVPRSTLGFSYSVPSGTLEVTFSTFESLETPVGPFILPAEVTWGTGFSGSQTISDDFVAFGTAGSTVIGVASPVPEPSSLDLLLSHWD
jgi:hypothetical protein